MPWPRPVGEGIETTYPSEATAGTYQISPTATSYPEPRERLRHRVVEADSSEVMTMLSMQRTGQLQGPLSVVDDNQQLVGAVPVVEATKMSKKAQKIKKHTLASQISK